MKRFAFCCIAVCMVALAVPAQAQLVTPVLADVTGTCEIAGTLAPGEDAAVLCRLDHSERTSLAASVQTGSLDVQAWVLRATGSTVLVALRNTGPVPVVMTEARIELGRMVPATPQRFQSGNSTDELCIGRAIATRGDVALCPLWKTK